MFTSHFVVLLFEFLFTCRFAGNNFNPYPWTRTARNVGTAELFRFAVSFPDFCLNLVF